MAERTVPMTYTLDIQRDDNGMLWGEVRELPGCFASGADMDELQEAMSEAITMYLDDSQASPDNVVSMTDRRKARPEGDVHLMPTALVLEG